MTNLIELEIKERIPFAEGHDFGETGAYERVTGRAHFRVDPLAPAQAAVTDITLAPRDSEGLVCFSADFAFLRPVDPARGNRRMFFDYGNRGNKRALQFYNDAVGSNDPKTLDHAGNGFLMRRGYTVGWLAWQGDLLPGDGRMILDVPIATENGDTITGTTRLEYIPTAAQTYSFPISSLISTRSYPAASLDTAKAQLSRRQYAHSARQIIDPSKWAFARVDSGQGVDNQGLENAVLPSDSHIYMAEGFKQGWIYELIYEAKDPRVLGLGHVAVRDFLSFVKYDSHDAAGAANPLAEAGGIEKVYGWGRSQTGRCIRDFLHLGFNADAKGRRAFDGVLPHVAGAGKMWMNHRFANLVLLPGQEMENHFSCADRFPFSYAWSVDHLTGQEDAILKRPETDPLVIQTDTSAEYWHRRASLVHTDTRGNDLELPQNVRFYLWASSQHYASPLVAAPARGLARDYFNVVATSAFFRANLDHMDAWASHGTPPPPSRYPRSADQSLVSYEDWARQFPAIPGVVTPRGPSRLELLDFGPEIDSKGLIANEPPVVLAEDAYGVKIPAVDADGNEYGGVCAPMVQAPLGTYTGWAVRARDVGHGAMLGITGSYLPFPDTEDERAQLRDPRPSVLARYGSPEGYAARIEAAAQRLIEEGYMLEEDLPRARKLAQNWGRPRHDVRL